MSSDLLGAAAATPLMVAIGATLITWACTAAGAATVFVTPRLSARFFASLLVVAALIMGTAAVAGLMLPAWDRFAVHGPWGALALLIGLGAGVGLSLVCRRLLAGPERDLAKRPRLGRQLFTVMSLHHVPEGMAVGLAVAAASGGDAAATAAAALVVVAMASHNVFEGALVSLPLRQEGATRLRAFTFGQLSGLAEVVGALIGAGAASFSDAVLPWGLAAAAGAMLTVTVVDLLPELRIRLRPQHT